MEEADNNSSVLDFHDYLMDQLLSEDCLVETTQPHPFSSPSLSCILSDPPEEHVPSISSSLALMSVKERLICAIGYLQELMGERELLIQLWVPIERGSRRVLTTEEQPYSLNPFSLTLALYRHVSAGYSFAAELGSDQLVGLPGRVFLRKMPEWTPDVRFFRSEEYPRIGYARKYQVRASLALPVFQGASRDCLAVMEMVTTKQNMEYGSELHTIFRALQAFDLRSSQTSIVPPVLKPHTDLHTEVATVLQDICSSYGLPLALTWGRCIHHSNQDTFSRSSCVSSLVSASFAADQDSRCFLAASSEHHLLGGEGIAGRAFATNKRCFATDVAVFSKWSYPLSHYARMFNLHAALAIPLLSRRNRTVHLVLELFFPRDCLDTETQRWTLNLLAAEVNQRFQRSPHLVVDEDIAEQVIFPVKDSATPMTENSLVVPEESPWISHMVEAEAKEKGKEVSVSWEYRREELKVGSDSVGGSIRDSSSSSSENRKRKTKAEKEITLDILRQHFAGNLKDAAKNIGVCPTTLKRICRQHGILRWPSRKIKKVGHSLRKLQVVIDSVEGVQGSLHLGSFYSSFPQLQSSSSSASFNATIHQPSQTVTVPHEPFNLISVPPKSPPSSSGSQSSSGSSICCSSEEQPLLGGLQKPALSHPQLLTPSSLQEQKPLRVTSSLPPLPAAKTSRKGKDGMKVKATFGESKVRISLQQHWRLTDLRREIAKRFGIDDGLKSSFNLKYLDDDKEWVLLTCDADLEECIQVYKTSLKKTIRILVLQPLSSFL